jgi:hypothetical protein
MAHGHESVELMMLMTSPAKATFKGPLSCKLLGVACRVAIPMILGNPDMQDWEGHDVLFAAV